MLLRLVLVLVASMILLPTEAYSIQRVGLRHARTALPKKAKLATASRHQMFFGEASNRVEVCVTDYDGTEQPCSSGEITMTVVGNKLVRSPRDERE